MILLLDVMGTIVRDPFHDDMPAFFGMSLQQLLAEKHPSAWVRFERDEIDGETFLREFFADGRDYDRAGFVRCVREGYAYLDGMDTLLADLAKAEAAIHALSNYPRWSRWIEEKLNLERYLQWTFVSWKTGLRKPDPDAYLRAARDLQVSPSECLFVDDRESNVRAARSIGMQALQFSDARTLRAELQRYRLLP
ncbi:MAG: HAD-IA family hydrolase [Myxococcota bacterium]